jgi:hypothetical protein
MDGPMSDERQDVCIVHEAVADRIGDGGIAEGRVPVGRDETTGDHRRRAVVAILEDFEEVATLAVLERGDQEVVEHEHLGLRELSEHARVRAVGASDRAREHADAVADAGGRQSDDDAVQACADLDRTRVRDAASALAPMRGPAA